MNDAGFGAVAEALRRATVLVRSGGSWRSQGMGSGTVWDGAGVVVTNNHVARSRQLEVQLWDGRPVRAEVAARDEARDLALLKIPGLGAPAAPVRASTTLQAGELVIAIGNPLGFQGALSRGVIHGVGVVPGLGPRSWVQASVRLAPGNSGGPLADAQGRVVGINTMVAGALGLAIPSDVVARFVRGELGIPPRFRLGVTLRPVQAAANTRGLLIVEIERGGAADRASLLRGDLLTGAGGRPLADPEDLAEMMEGSGGRLRLAFLRGSLDAPREVTVELQPARVRAA